MFSSSGNNTPVMIAPSPAVLAQPINRDCDDVIAPLRLNADVASSSLDLGQQRSYPRDRRKEDP